MEHNSTNQFCTKLYEDSCACIYISIDKYPNSGISGQKMNRKQNAFSHFITIYSSVVSASVPIGAYFIFFKLNIYSILFYPINLEGRWGHHR